MHKHQPTDQDAYSSPILLLNNWNEQTLWNDFLKGSDTALSYIYRKYSRPLFNYGRQFADNDLVLDSIQDLFYDLIRSRKKLSMCKSVKAYLYSSLRRKILKAKGKNGDEVNQTSVEQSSSFNISFVPDESQTLDNLQVDQLKLIQDACNSLPMRQREIILLYYFEELSYDEIIEIMNIKNVPSARILVHRAIESLRSLLSNVKNELLLLVVPFLF